MWTRSWAGVHAFNLSIWETEPDGSLSLRLAWLQSEFQDGQATQENPVSKNWKNNNESILNLGPSNNGVQWDLYRKLQGNYLCIILHYSCSVFYVPYDACANMCVFGCVCVCVKICAGVYGCIRWVYVWKTKIDLGCHLQEPPALVLKWVCFYLSSGLLMGLGWLAMSPRDSFVSTSPGKGLQVCTTMPNFI